jgi:hypothetical protein
MQGDIEIPDFDETTRAKLVVGRRTDGVMPTTERERVQVGGLLSESSRPEVRGFYSTARSAHYAAERPEKRKIFGIAHRRLYAVDRSRSNLEGLHVFNCASGMRNLSMQACTLFKNGVL